MAAGRLLDTLRLPEDLHDLEERQMRMLAAEIREEIIQTVARTGGHLGASLGVVELTLALHAELRSPVDKLVWDVGHQCYAHKLVTGRVERFGSIRTTGGLSGFPKPEESPHDAVATGHSSTSISVGMGIAEALRARGAEGRVVAVIGDGALTGGMAYEGLNQAGHLRTPMVVVLNDNDMSIRRNVGAMSSYLSRIRSVPGFYRLRRDLERRVQRFPGIGERVFAVGEQLKDGVKAALVPGMLFEELGFTYLGVTDGHDVDELRGDIRRALAINGPVVLHVRTVKGKGYLPAEREPDRFHGVSGLDLDVTGRGGASSRRESRGARRRGRGAEDSVARPPETKAAGEAVAVSYTEAFGRGLVSLAAKDDRIVGITAAMASGTGLDLLEESFPDRVFDVGIAEAHALGFAAGLAAAGRRPVVALYSTFLQRAYDQVIHDICLPGLPVVLAVDRAGLVGEDGPTHHGAFDLSFLRVVPGLSIFVPKDEAELQRLLATALSLDSPSVIRYPRGRGRGVALPSPILPLQGPWIEVLSSPGDGDGEALLLACGTGIPVVERAAALLSEQGVRATVANVRRVRPLDEPLLHDLVARHEVVVTVEENALAGGFGSAVLESLADAGVHRRMVRVGLPDRFVRHGDTESLWREVGFDARETAERTRVALGAAALD
jgi:1-deoxy-D-xylulose-5-phosphate synthase